MTTNPNSEVVTRRSAHSVDETVSKLQDILIGKGITLFAVIDHSGAALQAGLHMPNTKLVVFGNAKAGTPIMLACPSAAIDLPLKILVSEDSSGEVWISYNSTSYLQKRHGFPPELASDIAGVEAIANSL